MSSASLIYLFVCLLLRHDLSLNVELIDLAREGGH